MDFELLFRDGIVVDGTGADRTRANVAITDGEIVDVGPDLDGADADRTVSVDGSIIAPGFVDVLSYADLQLFVDPTRVGKVRQGITTELVGTSGYSVAPRWYTESETYRWRPGKEDWKAFLSTDLGRADDAWDWGSVQDYLQAVDEAAPATNVATFVGHGSLKYNVTGLREVPPTAEEVEELCTLLELGLRDGAVGLSTSIPLLERSATEEITALLDRLTGLDRPLVVRASGADHDTLSGILDIVEPAGVVHLTDLAGRAGTRTSTPVAAVEAAADCGLTVTGDVTPYDREVILLASLLPPESFAEGDQKLRELLAADGRTDDLRRALSEAADWSEVVLVGDRDGAGATVEDLAARQETTVTDLVCELLMVDLETRIEVPVMDPDVRDRALSDRRITVATDGSLAASRTRREHGTFAAFLEHSRENVGLEEAIRKLTSLPADAFGLEKKGRIEPGADADLVVFDPADIADRTTREDPTNRPTGVRHVLVGGRFVVRAGEAVEESTGRTIRFPTPT